MCLRHSTYPLCVCSTAHIPYGLCGGGPEKRKTVFARIRQKYNGVPLCPSLLLPLLALRT